MLIKDKDILVEEEPKDNTQKPSKPARPRIKKENMRVAWGDAFDYYLRSITEYYLLFRGRATRLNFWGYATVAGIVMIPIYFLGDYVNMPLFQYYALATAVPSLAVLVRRLHDLNKKARYYLISGAICLASYFFIELYAVIPILLWSFILIRLLSRETDYAEGLYGTPEECDEMYAEDNLPIIHKFRFIAIVLALVWFSIAGAKFDDWSRQAQQEATIDDIMEQVTNLGMEANLNPQQLKEAEQNMIKTLKRLNGQTVSPDELQKQIKKAVDSVINPPLPLPQQ